VRQRVDRHFLLAAVRDGSGAGQGVGAVDVHRARTTDAFAAGAAEGQGRVDLVLDLDQGVQDHRATGVQIDFIGIGARVAVVVRTPAVDLEGAHILAAVLDGEVLALRDLGILGE
jgi:hypothetical protein